jgi:crotonobetainyl-CoA:carnitine CoA-transferase CaiB-like acyl-CoA transferase
MISDNAQTVLRAVWQAAGGDAARCSRVAFTGAGALPSVFPVTALAAGAVAAAALAVAELAGVASAVTVDRRLASFWFAYSIKPDGWTMPPPWDPIAGDYPAADGWIRLHTNAPHHRAAALKVLGTEADREAVAAAVARRRADDLEAAVVAAGGCAATMRSLEAWAAHDQGKAVGAEPLLWQEVGDRATAPGPIDPARPLAGIRVLDLTRVLAGPVATRFLAGFGAEVLRIDPPDWDEPAILPEVTLGKRCARLDLRQAEDRERLKELLAAADIVVHGYRPGALDRLGLDAAERRRLRPGLIDVSLDAYGWTGTWAGRRGFDSLVQMSTGIADSGMRRRGKDRPTPLPVQALDHAAGYVLAAAAIRGLAERRSGGLGSSWRTSLARVAALLTGLPRAGEAAALAKPTDADYDPAIETTGWGPARRLLPPLAIAGTPMRWDRPAAPLGTAPASWL